ncbi:MAG: tRNA (adenosine(37)-N6)-threonylcarbamoyltransferase complex ATPase subunit type 1 TsaE [Cyanobacteria bacterium QS_8_64_29]|nr:MAG: tRNA (adenosine(37)-N6)-threonylcarbamoyltransferase complex ATPase subunit type 1 TsaE [Cyanobacteria bacterium QS_8_64_29]
MAERSLTVPDEGATQQLGERLGRVLEAGSVVLLRGDLGAGKTTLIRGIGAALGVREPIVSPTFTLINEYPQGRLPLYHLDLYRLQPAEVAELEPDRYWESTEVPPGIAAVEWAERLPERPPSYLEIWLTLASGEARWARLQAAGAIDERAIVQVASGL